MNHRAVVVFVEAILLMSLLQGCVEVPYSGVKSDRASIAGTLHDATGKWFTERVVATLTQGTSVRKVSVENGEFRFDNLLATVECSLAFTTLGGEPIGKKDQITLKSGENLIDYRVEKKPDGIYILKPSPKDPKPSFSPGPVK